MTTVDWALARARAAEDAEDEAAERAATGRLRRAWTSRAESGAGPSGLRGGTPGPPPKGGPPERAGEPAKAHPTPQEVARASDGRQGPSAVDRQGFPAPPAPLDSAEFQHLSPTIEERRRILLASERERWESRVEERRAEYEAARVAAVEAGAQVDAAELGDMARTARRLAAAAVEAREALEGATRRLKYARARVASLASDLGPRLAVCGKRRRWIRCRCENGDARAIDEFCRQRAACEGCRDRWAGRIRYRALEAVGAWVDRERGRRGRFQHRVRVRMITMTVRHSGSIARDRAELVKGWEALRKQLHRWFGPLPFMMIPEVEPGRDGRGHEHLHVVIIGGPVWWPYAKIQRTWATACPRSARGPGIQIDVAGSKRQDGDPVKSAANYITKYASKGARIGGDGWSEELVAQVIAAHYGKKWITTSHGFWSPPEPICATCHAHVHRAAAPGAYYERTGLRRVVWGPYSELSNGPPMPDQRALIGD